MLGHVNNAVYQQWFEWGRFDWVRAAQLQVDDIANYGVALVVVHVSLDYRRECRLDDAIAIETVLEKIGSKSLNYRQRARHADGGVACDGKVVLACLDLANRVGKPIPPPLRERLAQLTGELPPT